MTGARPAKTAPPVEDGTPLPAPRGIPYRIANASRDRIDVILLPGDAPPTRVRFIPTPPSAAYFNAEKQDA